LKLPQGLQGQHSQLVSQVFDEMKFAANSVDKTARYASLRRHNAGRAH